jgi:hypothetical protein
MRVPPAVTAAERHAIMKKLIGIAAFVLVFSVPTHGQASKGPVVGSSGSGATGASGGSSGGGFGGGLNGTGTKLPAYPAARFGTSSVSGGDPSFAPSTFLTFEQAIAEGKSESANQKSLAEVAAENSVTSKTKAKFAFVQDAKGKVVPAPQQ